MTRYQKYQSSHLPSFRNPNKSTSSILSPYSNPNSYSQEPYRLKPRTQQSHIDPYPHRDFSPQPSKFRKTRQPYDTTNDYSKPNTQYRPKETSSFLAPPSSSKYDLTSSSVSALTTYNNSSKKKSYSDIGDVESLSKSHVRQRDGRDKGERQNDRSPGTEDKEYLKEKYKNYISESRVVVGKKKEDQYRNKEYPKGDDISLIPHKLQGRYDSYHESKYDSKIGKGSAYRSSNDFKKQKSNSRYDDTSYKASDYKTDYKLTSSGFKDKYTDEYVGSSKSYKSEIKQNYITKDYSKSSYKPDYKVVDYISQIKDQIKKDFSTYPTDISTTTSSAYNLQSSSISAYKSSSTKLLSQKSTAYTTALSQKQQIKEAKKKYMDEMKTKLNEVNGLIQQSKELHLENEKTLNSFTYLSKPKIVYEKIKFIADIRDFQIGKQKGEGKFGTVHQAVHKATKTLYAIKKIPKDTIKTYMLENQLALQLKIQTFVEHPNILKIFGFFDDWQYVYIVLEYMQQGTLFEYLRKTSNNRLPQKDVAKKISEITNAIKYLHDMDIAHRDIKPQNIVLSYGVAKLCDFGWATRCTDRRQTYCGTFDYAAPEILEGKQYNQCVDLWCLGILTYELLYGRSPFYHLSKEETKKKVLRVDREDIEFPKDVDISWKAKDFIESLLKKNPSERRRVDSLVSHPFLTD